MSNDRLAEIKQRLQRFAEHEVAGASPLYEHLAGHAATDDDVAGLLLAAPDDQAKPTLLLATAHRLVQAEPLHPLSRYYPTLGGFDGVDRETWPLFRDFLLERAEPARAIMATRSTQTNEVGRAALLYPAVALAAKQATGKVALLEVGCSAGLLLGLDRFNYRYQCAGGEQLTAGPTKTAIGLHCALELAPGAAAPHLPKKLPVAARLGLDREPVDAADEEELAWLEACVWADQPERARLLRSAAYEQRKHPPELVAGDAVDDLRTAVDRLPADAPLVVMTSHTLPYLAPERRAAFVAELARLAGERPLWWVSEENYEVGLTHVAPGQEELSYDRTAQCTLGMVSWSGGQPLARVLATTAPHGQRMAWLAG
ncbi:DUF2332 domain-containing protein [Haloechinothrix sp. YIM 98757]|uniref:DUF2332 domain-containing protein n=1 Tax=Haloechinothrix aidingensis TaxID=2752311 RepID=A0A838AF58_9PSEU|nr:DUF2332 domain-containing protein [Haloechinothrix aidingensis]MBA0127984.1 DUF2332 domain-containing protein [Haloechinothrix aidingensis]